MGRAVRPIELGRLQRPHRGASTDPTSWHHPSVATCVTPARRLSRGHDSGCPVAVTRSARSRRAGRELPLTSPRARNEPAAGARSAATPPSRPPPAKPCPWPRAPCRSPSHRGGGAPQQEPRPRVPARTRLATAWSAVATPALHPSFAESSPHGRRVRIRAAASAGAQPRSAPRRRTRARAAIASLGARGLHRRGRSGITARRRGHAAPSTVSPAHDGGSSLA